jgi:hypothetical protein
MYLTPTTVYILVWPYRKVRSWGLRTINTPPPFEFNMPDTTVHILVRPYRKVGSWGLRIQYLLSVIYASDHPFISQYDLPEGQKWGITDHHSLCILTQVLVRFTGSVIDASIDHYRTSAFTKLWEIEYKGWELTLKIPYSGRLELTSLTQNNRTSHSVGNRTPDPPSGICEYPHDPPEEQELAPNCHTIKRPPLGICEQLTDPPGE